MPRTPLLRLRQNDKLTLPCKKWPLNTGSTAPVELSMKPCRKNEPQLRLPMKESLKNQQSGTSTVFLRRSKNKGTGKYHGRSDRSVVGVLGIQLKIFF
mmetsp:Transcript_39640/g.81463  ORF Transcript_39640/g.81463 Transcript_39640/m.81463 type:complete len:98 (-) Transcript_39640:458-751(-)